MLFFQKLFFSLVHVSLQWKPIPKAQKNSYSKLVNGYKIVKITEEALSGSLKECNYFLFYLL